MTTTASACIGDLHTRVVQDLGRRIVTGALRPGCTFRIKDLATDLGVSLGVAREAVRVLEGVGLLTSRKHVGVRVQQSTQWHLLDPRVLRWHAGTAQDAPVHASLMQVVLGVAADAAARAADHASPDERQDLVTAALGLDPTPDFLVRLLGAAHDSVYDHLAGLARLLQPRTATGVASRDDAIALAVALNEGDAEAARAAMAGVAASWARAVRTAEAACATTVHP